MWRKISWCLKLVIINLLVIIPCDASFAGDGIHLGYLYNKNVSKQKQRHVDVSVSRSQILRELTKFRMTGSMNLTLINTFLTQAASHQYVEKNSSSCRSWNPHPLDPRYELMSILIGSIHMPMEDYKDRICFNNFEAYDRLGNVVCQGMYTGCVDIKSDIIATRLMKIIKEIDEKDKSQQW